MGVQACPLPTAILSAQTEYPSFYSEDLTANIPFFIKEWDRLHEQFDGIHTGYITSKEQILHIFRFLDLFHQEDTFLLVDPVMGDTGDAYQNFDADLLDHMKKLIKRADLITPNITECCLLTGIPYESLLRYRNEEDYLQAIREAGQKLKEETGAHVIITGISPPSSSGDIRTIGNMYFNDSDTFYSSSPYNGKSYSGTGDLFASVLMGSMMRGDNLRQAIRLAEDFLSASIEDAGMEGVPEIAGVNFEKHLRLLL